ncbi:MAG TPA: hypothetical protein VGN63_10490 [Flavisolibacter sp.]|jgi:hypothetical protein|nr:hypothetical protein [Flavisolibacter sp.]
MKHLSNSALRCQGRSFLVPKGRYNNFRNTISYFGKLTLLVLLLASCQKDTMRKDADDIGSSKAPAAVPDAQVLNDYTGHSGQTMWELQQARAATARYRNIQNAIKDGYEDIKVIVPLMGHHYMKSDLVNATFDIRNPEILVYNKNAKGLFELVAVEYAIPIDQSPDVAPEGFTGTQDVWDRNTGFGLWLLHAWVWSYNPDGVFNPTNPLIHMH